MYEGTLYFEDSGIQSQNICYGYNTGDVQNEANQNDKPMFELLSGAFIGSDGVSLGNFDFIESLGPADCRVRC